MTTLVIETLRDELVQEFNLKLNRRYHIASIAPYLYVHNAPAGVFTVALFKGADHIWSKNFSSEDLKESLETENNFLHVFYPLIPSSPLYLNKGSYSLKLSATGYSSNSHSFLAWVKQHENLNNEVEYVLNGHENLPLAVRMKEYIEAGL